jgi:CheY-like chemotaxis protein
MARRRVREDPVAVTAAQPYPSRAPGAPADRPAGARGVEIVGEAGTVGDAVAVIHAERPDVVLLDVHMPDGGGLAVLAGVAPELPEVRFRRCRSRTPPPT